MKFEPGDDFERELQQALARRPAPPSLKRRLMEKRRATRTERTFVPWQRMAASLAIAAALASGAVWRNREEHRKEEAARQQVITALRITGQALNRMNTRLAAHGRAAAED
jgi:hypothetical protein